MTDEEITLILQPGEIELEMRLVPAGQFIMGSTNGDEDEQPVHEVIISKPFFLGQYEVTQAQWEAVMGNNPSLFKIKKRGHRPVERVSWEEASDFCEKMNDLCKNVLPAGYRFDLPTEAQWEYACRSGSTGDYSGDSIDEIAWYESNSYGRTCTVGMKSSNAWGLYDMHGNVWEWCRDWKGDYPSSSVTDPTGPSSGEYRVCRGGGWLNIAWGCRSALRFSTAPSFRSYYLGFRLALVPVQ
jgi:formylglycine-generating enzyme required for sulfatase activity